MNRMVRLGVMSALIGIGLVAANAQTGTNVVLGANITLNGVVQSGDAVNRAHAGTKDVIAAIGTQLSTTFSAKAKLLIVFPAGGGGPSFVIRDNGTDTTVDSGILRTVEVGDSVESSKTSPNGVIAEKDTAIREFILNTTTLGFDVRGYTTSTSDNKGRNGGELFTDTTPRNASAKVAGTGHDAGGNNAVVQGSISIGGRKVEEVP